MLHKYVAIHQIERDCHGYTTCLLENLSATWNYNSPSYGYIPSSETFLTEVQHGLLAEKQHGVDALNHLVHRQKFI
jgi:hypothetical protein